MPPLLLITLGPLTYHISQVAALHLGVVENLLQLPGQLLVLVHLSTLLVELVAILLVLIFLILVIMIFLLFINLHNSFDMLTVEDILVLLLLQTSLPFLSLPHEVACHLLLRLLIKLLRKALVNLVLGEARQVCDLLLQLLTSQLLLSFAEGIPGHVLHGPVLRDSHRVR